MSQLIQLCRLVLIISNQPGEHFRQAAAVKRERKKSVLSEGVVQRRNRLPVILSERSESKDPLNIRRVPIYQPVSYFRGSFDYAPHPASPSGLRRDMPGRFAQDDRKFAGGSPESRAR